ncbi:carboxyl-terminal processing protease [Alkalispirillum mobile]|uniref:Carboxyl-terminal processing protease n=1 Tax=Alkalispirillum mobile TaxID=85925 RepID=A0A498BZK3_9GAMM|nr:S41 family peptidase [Alkalispirillum mobile]RLK48179.1 carboxyl-terminal processing protease [Alkalispirillum mobile]
MRMIRPLYFTAALLLLAIWLGLGQTVWAERQQANAELPLEKLQAVAEVYARIRSHYVDEVDDEELLEAAVRGMLSSLDPHSSYLDSDEFKALQEGTRGEFGGLGIEVGMEDGFIKVIAPIDDTPASRAGLRPGDLITRIDDEPIKGKSLNEAVKRMRGEPGSTVELTVVREGEDRPITFELTRDVIQVQSVRSRMLEPGYGYLRISQFQERTGRDVREALSDLKKEADGSLRGLVLDLRNNPGGVLDGAVSVSDIFLSNGRIVYTEGRDERAEMDFNATPVDMLHGAPMVVLVNRGSASASEIVAGALQDHGRAVIMGSPTFGKGSVQSILPLGRDSAIKLTTARYYTPGGRSIQDEGIQPDILSEDLKVSRVERERDDMSEAELERHLQGERPERDDEAERTLAQEDFTLYEALNLLKGVGIFTGR